MNRLYVDTSAYLAVLLGEKAHAKKVGELRGELLSSSLLALEADRTLVRYARERLLDPQRVQDARQQLAADLRAFVLRDLTLDLCAAGPWPSLSTPRSLDLAHLRTALWFHAQAPLTRFLTADDAQRTAASELGLPT